MKLIASLSLTILLFFSGYAQKPTLDLQKIWSGHFDERKYVVQLMNQSPRFAWIQTDTGSGPQVILALDFHTTRIVDTLFSNQIKREADSVPTTFTYFQDFRFSPDDKKILIKTQVEPNFTVSEKSFNYVWNVDRKNLLVVSANGKQLHPDFSPDSKYLSYVLNGNIFLMDTDNNKTIPVTVDGSSDQFLYGMADGLYENGFGMSKAYEWSPDSRYIAMLRFNENVVKQYPITLYERPYAEIRNQRYPLAGEMVPDVKVFIYDVINNLFVAVDAGVNPDQYITGIRWAPDNKWLLVQRLTRDQKRLDILKADVETGKTTVLFSESAPDNYLKIYPENIQFIDSGRHFLWLSEKDGYTHLYKVSTDAGAMESITTGKWEVSRVESIDDEKKEIFYTGNEANSRQKQLYKINYDGKGRTRLTNGNGYHNVWISNDKRYFFDEYSSVNTPTTYQVSDIEGRDTRKLIENKELKDKLKDYRIPKAELFTMRANDTATINGWIIRPVQQVRSRPPLILYVYGGGDRQETLNRWNDKFMLTMSWFTSQGYAVACIDPRGTPGKGQDFRKAPYKLPGDTEMQDLLAAKEFLARNYRIDSSNVAIMGWSYGGYLAALAQTKYADRFKAAVAIAPVTNWRLYENIYAERLLGLPAENAEGYKHASPVTYAPNYKGGLFLVHGTADDNVHLHNSMELSKRLTDNLKTDFEQHFYPDKTHNLSDGTPNVLRISLYTRVNDFLKRTLK